MIQHTTFKSFSRCFFPMLEAPCRCSIAFALLIGMLSPVASAEQETVIPEVRVTADFHEATLQEIPTSVSIINSGAIAQRNAQHLEDVLALAPNVNFAQGTSRARFFQIRGIGERSQFTDPVNPSVGVIIDGVDFSGVATAATLFDVDQVEILRGPQGTRYGANALAGLINIKTKEPTDHFTADIEGTLGDYDTSSVGATISGPFSDALLGRLALARYRSDGFTDNDFLGRDDVNERDELTLRGKLRWLATDALSLDMSVFHLDVDNGYDAFSFDNTRRTLSDQPGRDRQESTALSLIASWEGANVATQALFSYQDSDTLYSYDEDWTFAGFHPDGYSSEDIYLRDREATTFELRMTSVDSVEVFGCNTDWVVGLYGLETSEELQRIYTGNPDFDSRYDTQTISIYGQLDTELAANWMLTTGLRVEHREADYDDSNAVTFNPNKTFWGGRIALQYLFASEQMLYVSAARGYKANGFNTDGSLDEDLREFDSEYLWEFELGLKGSYLDGALQARAAFFYDLRRDQQVKSSITRVRDNGSTEFIDFTGNAAEGTNLGLELETTWQPLSQLKLFASVGLLYAEFDDYINEFGEDLSGRDQAHAPNYQFALGGQWDFASNWYLRVEAEGKDAFYFSDRHAEKSTAYELVHTKLGYRTDGWEVALWGRNLGDEDYYTRGFGSFGNDPSKGYATEPYYQFGEPRTLGVTGKYRF